LDDPQVNHIGEHGEYDVEREKEAEAEIAEMDGCCREGFGIYVSG
jgi:hypothetical protein